MGLALSIRKAEPMPHETGRCYRATACVTFPQIGAYADNFVESIATHDMTIDQRDGVYEIGSAFGRARFAPRQGGFDLTVEADDPGALNRLKHALVGPIGFIAAREQIDIVWKGDHAEPALPDDLRILTVAEIENLTPRLRRILFHGDNLGRYDRDDQFHCRLIFQPRGIRDPRWPMLDHRGHVVWPDGEAVPTRVYTIRHINAEAGELSIDFALHADPGPATRWALDARPGDIVGVLGPAAQAPKSGEFYCLIGDETALPGIARILETLPVTARGHAFVEVNGADDQIPLLCPSALEIRWIHREGRPAGTTTLLAEALQTVEWPLDWQKTSVWGGCEHRAFSTIYRYLKHHIGLPRDRIVFYSHWHRLLSEEDIIAKGAEAYLPD
jgi:NADPH-dependent ferric siderophore reductase